MRRAISIVVSVVLWSFASAYAGCSTDDLNGLKVAGYTTEEITNICPHCTSQQIIDLSRKGFAKSKIMDICKKGNADSVLGTEVVKMPWYRMLLLKSISLSFDAYHTNEILKAENIDNTLKKTSSDGDLFNLAIKYTLPFSSMSYAFNDTPPEKPSAILKNLKFYIEGNYGNSINQEDAGSAISIKTEKTLSYKVGIKLEVDMDTMFPSGKKYKYADNY